MGLTVTLTEPLYTGSVTSSGDVPALFPVAIGGHPYEIDLSRYERQSVEVIRQQADQSDQPSERSFNPVALWRRSIETWHHGAGQTNLDLTNSDPARFRASKGVDPWTPGEIALLPGTDRKLSSAATNLRCVVAGSRIYVTDGQTTKYTTDITPDTPTWTSVTGTPAETPTSITSDGFHVWVAYPSGTWETNTGVSTASALGTQDVDVVAYTNGRLVASHDDLLFTLDAAGAKTDLYDHRNSEFRWDVIASAPNAIYACGHAGTKGEVYRITVEDTGTALGAPTAATFLPDGEYVTSLLAYVGVIVLGTNKGVRLASPDASGNLTYGPLVTETSGSVFALEGEDRFVWFGWTNYDGTDTGLGRLDLSVFVDTVRPAYASDLMAVAQGAVLSACTFGGRRVFTVSGSGVWAEDTVKVASGTIDSGLIRWGTTERKIVVNADMRTQPLPAGASVALSVAYDDLSFDAVASLTTTGMTGPSQSFSTREQGTEQAEMRLVLTRATSTAFGPVVLRATVKALVTPSRAERIVVPIVMVEYVKHGPGDGQQTYFDSASEYRYLKALELAGTPVTYQEGNETWTVTVQRVGFEAESWRTNNAWLNGICLVLLETIEG